MPARLAVNAEARCERLFSRFKLDPDPVEQLRPYTSGRGDAGCRLALDWEYKFHLQRARSRRAHCHLAPRGGGFEPGLLRFLEPSLRGPQLANFHHSRGKASLIRRRCVTARCIPRHKDHGYAFSDLFLAPPWEQYANRQNA